MHRKAASTRIGFLTPSALVTAFLVLIIIAGITLLSGGALFSPDPLNALPGPLVLGGVSAHAGLKDCAACHPAPWSGQSMSGLCLNCHTDLKDDPRNFHQLMVAQGKQSTCTACHTEHHGANAALTHMDMQDFPHAALGFSLQGHPKMADGSLFLCTGCHTSGYSRFDAVVCTTCHTLLKAAFVQGHAAVFGFGCLACHDGIDTYGSDFDHQKVAFLLAGKHAALDCARCHSQARSNADLKAAQTACFACHAKDDAHQGGLGQDCAQCHSPEGWDQAKIDHSLTRFPLTGKHQAVECTACHINHVFKGTAAACFACHAKDDAHQGGLGQDCALCHTTAGWLLSTFDHTKTSFQLTGAHIKAACQRCHVSGPNGVVYKGTPNVCSACHADPAYHRGLLGLNCATCHTTTAWTTAKFSQAHIFPINHEGAGGNCRRCHPSALAQYTCTSCHSQNEMANKHRGRGDISNCIACHPSGREGGGSGD